jgi:hypothetical protein
MQDVDAIIEASAEQIEPRCFASDELYVRRITGIMQLLEQRARKDVPWFGETDGRSPATGFRRPAIWSMVCL